MEVNKTEMKTKMKTKIKRRENCKDGLNKEKDHKDRRKKKFQKNEVGEG